MRNALFLAGIMVGSFATISAFHVNRGETFFAIGYGVLASIICTLSLMVISILKSKEG